MFILHPLRNTVFLSYSVNLVNYVDFLCLFLSSLAMYLCLAWNSLYCLGCPQTLREPSASVSLLLGFKARVPYPVQPKLFIFF